MSNHSRKKLTQKEVEKRVDSILKNTPYVLKQSFKYNTVRNTFIELYCPIHNYTWTVSMHQFLYMKHKNDVFGCPQCKLQYTKERCHEAALTCQYRSEFAFKFKGEYFAALRNNWLDEICSHMIILGNRYKRCIYSYEFNINDKKYVYVGLTDHLEKRDKGHKNKGSVFNFCKKYNINKPKYNQLTDYIDVELASKKEGEILLNYIINGWIPINKVKTGGLGGHLRRVDLTFKDCKKVGEKYKSRSEWKRNDYPTYYISSKFGWIDKILKQKERFGNKNQRYWTNERIQEVALKYDCPSDFKKNEPSAYQMAFRNGILEKICSHMIRKRVKSNLTLEIVKQQIEKYETLTDFYKNEKQMCDWLHRQHIKLRDISNKAFKKTKGKSKPVCQYTKDGVFVRRYNNAREAEIYGFSFKNISAVCHGDKKSHKGYIFKFENEKTE